MSIDWSQPLHNGVHEQFAQLIADNVDASEAYRQTHPGVKDKTANECASRLSKKVKSRVAALRSETNTERTLSRQERRELIANRARADDVKDNDLVGLLTLDAKLAGELSDTVNVNLRQPLTPEQILAAVQRSPALQALGKS